MVILVFQALSQAKALQKEVDLLQGSPYLHGLRRVSELKTLSLSTLKSLQAQLRSDLEAVEKVMLLNNLKNILNTVQHNTLLDRYSIILKRHVSALLSEPSSGLCSGLNHKTGKCYGRWDPIGISYS
jgi:hypothetical protein